MIANPTAEGANGNRPAYGPSSLPMSARTALVGLETVRAALGVDADNVFNRVESGELQWVFNLAAGKEKRELRFWLVELANPASTAQMNLADVTHATLGTAATIQRGELERRWVVSHVTIGRWIGRGLVELAAPGLVSRESLARFLARRWLGAETRLAPPKSKEGAAL